MYGQSMDNAYMTTKWMMWCLVCTYAHCIIYQHICWRFVHMHTYICICVIKHICMQSCIYAHGIVLINFVMLIHFEHIQAYMLIFFSPLYQMNPQKSVHYSQSHIFEHILAYIEHIDVVNSCMLYMHISKMTCIYARICCICFVCSYMQPVKIFWNGMSMCIQSIYAHICYLTL